MKRNSGFKVILVVVLFIIILWLVLIKNWADIDQTDELASRLSTGVPVFVAVYYEGLCTDSKNFILKQLKKTYERAPQLMNIQFIPYGKATTTTDPKDGSLSFLCQHGPIECQANIIHACVIEATRDPKLLLNMISCMIKDNMIPKDAFHSCSREFNDVDVETIQKCYSSPHGQELLKLHGEATFALRPRVSFIPTVTLDGLQGRQASILQDLFTEVCKVVAGSGNLPKICESF